MDKKRELKLIEEAKKSLKAFDELYEYYLPRIFGYIYNRIGRRELAEDLTSQTFIKAMSNIKSFEPRGVSFGAWLYRIAHNNIIDHVRKYKKLVNIELMENQFSEEGNQFEVAQSYEKKSIMRKALSQLHKDYQQILSLKFFEELDNREIADVMGLKKSTLAVKLHRSLRALRQILRQDEYKFLLGLK